MFTVILLLCAFGCDPAKQPPQITIIDDSLVFRFSDFPPRNEKEASLARVLMQLLALPRTKLEADMIDGDLLIKLRIEPMVLEKVRMDLSTDEAAVKKLARQFADVEIAIYEGYVFVYGPQGSVANFQRKLLARPTVGEGSGSRGCVNR